MIFRPLLASIPIFQTIYFCDYLALSKGSKTREESQPGEFHPQLLAEPDVNLSAHPAPIVQPNLWLGDTH
jgi:hypothetical protein